jgi:SAM-dependent methyltransferase
MRVLDVGSGPGSISLLVSELVGRAGAVVGVEHSAAMVELADRRARKAGRTNLRFVQDDVETANLTGPFDAVVGRFVLRELKDPERSLSRLLRLLRPGGIVAFQEKVLSVPVASVPPLPAIDRACAWMDEARRRAGLDVSTGAKLPRIFVAAGLPSPELRLDAPVGARPDWIGFDYLIETLRGILPLLHLYGIASEQEIAIDRLVDEMRAEAARTAGIVILTPCVGAWTATRYRTGGRPA